MSARACLPDIKWELAVEFAIDDFVGYLLNQFADPKGQTPSLGVDHGCSLLNVAVGVVNLFRHLVVPDVEMNQAALGLCTPIMACGYLNFANAIELFAQAGYCQANG